MLPEVLILLMMARVSCNGFGSVGDVPQWLGVRTCDERQQGKRVVDVEQQFKDCDLPMG